MISAVWMKRAMKNHQAASAWWFLTFKTHSIEKHIGQMHSRNDFPIKKLWCDILVETHSSKLFIKKIILWRCCKDATPPNTKIKWEKRVSLFFLRNYFDECVSANVWHHNFSFEKSFLECIQPMCFSVECVLDVFYHPGWDSNPRQ